MVPSERLELSRLSSLPPQDSVSTNSTTTAKTNQGCLRAPRSSLLTEDHQKSFHRPKNQMCL